MESEQNKERELIAEVADLYYNKQMGQQKIADLMFFSRSKVSRMLSEAKRLGIVEITINYPLERDRLLEHKLNKLLNINKIIIVKNNNNDEKKMLKKVCNIGSKFVDEIIKDQDIVGISWGTTVYNLIQEIKPHLKKQIKVVQLTGVINDIKTRNYDGSELVRYLAEKYHSEFYSLPLPLYIDDSGITKKLLQNSIGKTALELSKKANVIVTGISDFDVATNSIWMNSFDYKQRKDLASKGAVGIFLSHFIDENGLIVDAEVDSRIIAMKLEDIKNCKEVITIANGEKKALAIKAALKQNYINTLIIDDILANELLRIY